MEHQRKKICSMICVLVLSTPMAVKAQSEQSFMLDTLRLSVPLNVVEPELLKKGFVTNALDVLSGQAVGVNVTSKVSTVWLCSTQCVFAALHLSWVATTHW